jgi:hypothetical protein
MGKIIKPGGYPERDKTKKETPTNLAGSGVSSAAAHISICTAS